MNLFEYDAAIESCIDEETGEILDDRLDDLLMERDEKIENIAMWIKELKAEAEAIKTEKQKLASRQVTAENKMNSLKKYLSDYLAGDKFKTAKVAISYRSSEQVIIEDDAAIPVEFKKVTVEPNKMAIKDAISHGVSVPGAHTEKVQNIQIK